MKKVFAVLLMVLCSVSSVFAQDECKRDSFFPEAGNCGYDVLDYQMDIAWNADGDSWDVSEVISFTSEWDTDELRFDFTDAYDITSISVDGTAVEYDRQPTKLIVHYNFAHETEYKLYAAFSGKLKWGEIFDPEGETRNPQDGFCMLNEPTNAWRFFICNDHPRDKATYHYSFTVPADYVPAGIGRLLMIKEADETIILPGRSFERSWEPGSTEGTVTFTYEQNVLTAPYLFTVCAGAFDMKTRTHEDGKVQLDFVDHGHDDPELAWKLAGMQAEIISAAEKFFGEYPYEDLGAIVAKSHMGAALETQGRPVYDNDTTSEYTFAHEITHQWIGDLISPEDWSDLWIKEGAATFGEALWAEHTGGKEAYEGRIRNLYEIVAVGRYTEYPADETFLDGIKSYNENPEDHLFSHDEAVTAIAALCRIPKSKVQIKEGDVTYAEWEKGLTESCETVTYGVKTRRPFLIMVGKDPGDTDRRVPGPKEIRAESYDSIYSISTYHAAAIVYHSLRYRLGDEIFSKALQTLLEENKWGTVSEEKFIEAFSRTAGEDLSAFIKSYLYYELNGGHIPDLPGIETWEETVSRYDVRE